LAPAIAAVLRERGPARARDVLAVLRLQARVSSRPTFDEAQDAALLLVAQGTLEHVRRAGAGDRGGYFRVPGDNRARWDDAVIGELTRARYGDESDADAPADGDSCPAR
jgi:hypothetical protein